MATKVKIAELEIDDKALIASTAKVKKALDDLRKEQKELQKAGLESSKQYVQNASDIKALSSAYNSNIKALAENTKATADAVNREELLNTVLKEEVQTIQEARNQNKLLNKLRNETNITTEQGRKELEALNAALDSNNEFIKENADAYLQQKINIGNYKESIIEAANELNIFNGGIGGFISRSKEAGGVGNLLSGSLKGVTQGVLGMTKATLAFIATPIGAILAALVAAFALVRNALNRNEESLNKLKKAFAPFTGIVQGVLKALEPLGEFLIDTLVVAFDQVEKGLFKLAEGIASALDFLGFDEAAANLRGFTEQIQESARTAEALAQAEAELEKAQRQAQKTQLEYQKEAEKLRQLRDDESSSIANRIKANEELGVVLQNQLAAELEIANTALEVANLRIQAEGETKEALDAQAEALTTIADIQERITGQESEQLTNRIALQREGAEKAKEIADQAIAEQEAQLELFIQQQGVRAKTLQEQLDIARQVYAREVEILDANLKNRNITQTEYDAELLALKNDLALQQAELAVDNAQRELDAYISNNQSKLDSDKFFSDESLRLEQERLNGIAEKRREFEAKRLEEGTISQQEYNDAINTINEENRLRLEEAETAREEARKEKELIDLENKRIIDEENFLNEFEIQAQRLEQQRLLEVEEAERTGANIELINEKFAERKKALDRAVSENKVNLLTGALGNIAQIAGEETAVGKAAAIAQTTIDTYQAATSAYSSLAGITVVGPVLGAIAAAAAIAAGLANVRKITSTSTKFATGGIQEIKGARHSGGGVPIYAGSQYVGEAEGGEGIGILSRSAFGGFMDFNNSYNGGNSSQGYMAGGGIITQAVRPGSVASETDSLREAIQGMKIQVAVEDINTGQNNYAEVVNGADL